MVDEKAKDEIQQIFQATMASVFDRELLQEEYYYLLSRYPYLEVCDTAYPYIDKKTVPKVIQMKNGWQIFDYGTALFAGGSELMSMAYRSKRRIETGEDEGGSGTIVRQYTDVAFEMINLMRERGWGGLEILAGFYPMKRMAWIAAELNGIKVQGFDPSIEDHVVFGWVSKLKSGEFYAPGKTFVIP